MRLPLLLLALASSFWAAVPASGQETSAVQQQLDSLVWKNRVLLLFVPDADDKRYKEQKRLLASQTDAFDERDLVVVECRAGLLSRADRSYLIRYLQINPEAFGLWLIGKDGSVKLRSVEPVNPRKLNDLIDSMPMRQSEKRRH
jgi:hypothetical protein